MNNVWRMYSHAITETFSPHVRIKTTCKRTRPATHESANVSLRFWSLTNENISARKKYGYKTANLNGALPQHKYTRKTAHFLTNANIHAGNQQRGGSSSRLQCSAHPGGCAACDKRDRRIPLRTEGLRGAERWGKNLWSVRCIVGGFVLDERGEIRPQKKKLKHAGNCRMCVFF